MPSKEVESSRYKKGGSRYYKKPAQPKPAFTKLFLLPKLLLEALIPNDGDHPSVTTILSVLAKPALIGWAAREERKMIAALAGKLYAELVLTTDDHLTPQKFVEIVNEEAGKGAHLQLLAKASNVGTEVHNRIEWTLKGELGLDREPVEPPITSQQALNSWEKWQQWRVTVKLRPVSIERKIFCTLFGYGGTLDLLCYITLDGVEYLCVIDWKTGKHVYGEAFLQNVAYRMALQEEGLDPQIGFIVRLPKYEDDPEFEAVRVPDDPSLAPTFLALRIAYLWFEKDHPKPKRTPKTKLPADVALPLEVESDTMKVESVNQ